MQQDEIRYLVEQYMTGQLTEAQRQELLALSQNGQDAELELVLQGLLEQESLRAVPVDPETLRVSLERVLSVDKAMPEPATPLRRILARRWWAAAAIIIFLVGGTWVWHRPRDKAPIATQPTASTHDVLPGSNKAILTLSGGRQIILDSAANGNLAQQGNAQIQKLASGRLAYHVSSPTNGQTKTQNSKFKIYNTLSTPRGGQYQLTLPDGTRVWLNAASSITYPTVFTGKDRLVTISGEAYFEVAKNAHQPFNVKVGDLGIAVLGTSFNINAYTDEPLIKTTLLEGIVKVIRRKTAQLLTPGQQAQVKDDNIILVPHADTEQALAWKNGMVKLSGASIREVMRQVSRWYDVDIEYEGNLDKAVFVGVVSRQQTVLKLLEVLEATGSVHFTIGNKKIIVKP